MATIRSNGRAMRWARLMMASCCALAAFSGVALAQSANFRDARATLAKETNAKKTPSVAIPFDAPQRESVAPIAAEQPKKAAKFAQVRATKKASKPEPIRQAQYAESSTQSAVTQSLAENLDLDVPFVDECPDPSKMGSILDMPYKIVTTPGKFPQNCPLPDEEYHRKAPTPITFTWKASSLCHKPLYFEDVQLERYGHYCHPLLQPVCSRVRFWLTIPCLPYLMGVNPPQECIYDLGYYRPGNCAPSMIEPIPISLRGGLLEAGAVVGVAAALP